MGANYDSRIYLIDDKKVIEKHWEADVGQSVAEDGYSYSGCIGMLDNSIDWVRIVPFNSQVEASDYISENARKFGGPMAVPFKIQGGKAVPAYVKTAVTRYGTALENLSGLEDKVRKDFYNAKSQFVGCKKCKSKLSRSFLKTTFCPICNQSLLSTTSLQRVEKAGQKIKDTCLALGQARTKAKEQNCTGKIGYVIGGICSS